MGTPSPPLLCHSSKSPKRARFIPTFALVLASLLLTFTFTSIPSLPPPPPSPFVPSPQAQGPSYTTFTLSSPSRSYLVPNELSITLSLNQASALRLAGGGDRARLATVLLGKTTTCEDVEARVDVLKGRKGEDVWTEEFLEVLWLRDGGMSSAELSRCESQISGLGMLVQENEQVSGWLGWFRRGQQKDGERVIVKEGPYMIATSSTGQISFRPVFRLMDDTQQAFVSGVVPKSLDLSPSAFVLATGSDLNFHAAQVPVPFRPSPSSQPSVSRPLEGLRFGVKDIFDVAGLRTGCGSRAYASLYPPRNVTSPSIQRLIHLGAVLVGRTKTSQFANGENPTADWVDQMCPFNPRGDGYQDPGASSSGSAAAIAAYDWLDFTVGSDTGGSIRGPSGIHGVYGIRPSFGSISLEGVMPLAPTMDTAGWLARDPLIFERVGKAWLGHDQFASSPSLPKRLLTPSSASRSNMSSEYRQLFDAFVDTLASLLDAKTIEKSSIQELWNSTGQAETQEMDLNEFVRDTYPAIVSYAQGSGFGEDFRVAYRHANNGSSPFVNPSPLARWTWGLEKGEAFYRLNLERQRIFGEWFDGILGADEDSCSDGLLVYPASTGEPNYRNSYGPPPSMDTPTLFDFWLGRVGPLSGVPDMIFPIGQVPYNSTITRMPSMLPVSVSVVVRKGCDFVLIDLAKKLYEKGVLKEVKTGVFAY